MEKQQGNLRRNHTENALSCGGDDGGCADDDSAGLEHLGKCCGERKHHISYTDCMCKIV